MYCSCYNACSSSGPFGANVGHDAHAFMAQEDQRSLSRFIVGCVYIVGHAARTVDTVPVVDMGLAGQPEAFDSFDSESD